MKPQHFHLCAAFLLGVVAAAVAVNGHFVSAGFLAAGAVAALVHYKAAESGITD